MNTSETTVKTSYPWRVLAILAAAILISIMLITPYSLALQANSLKNVKLPMPLWLLLPIQWLETTILYALLAGLGLFMAGKIGLGLPVIEAWLARKPGRVLSGRVLILSIISGLAAGIAILLLDHFVFGPALNQEIQALGLNILESQSLTPPAWQGLLASFYGGVTEEILLRLFVLSGLAWLGRALTRGAGKPGPVIFWIANIITAILFGLGHLPATIAAGLPMDALVVTRAIVLNGLGGLVFGWLYWNFGLETAMLSHFSADIVLHVIAAWIARF